MTDDDTITSTRDYDDYDTEDDAQPTQPITITVSPPAWYPPSEHEQRKTGEHPAIEEQGPTDPPEPGEGDDDHGSDGEDPTVDYTQDSSAAAGA